MAESAELARGRAAFICERERMIEDQIIGRGISDTRVSDAMHRVPRHLFVPAESQAQAYEDHPVLIGQGQTISQPYMVAIMTELLELKPGGRVLEIGTGSGYQTAILAEIAAQVVSMERNETLAQIAKERLQTLGYDNILVITGDGTLGYPPTAPYDAILVTAGGPRIPATLKDQLRQAGILVCPAGSREIQTLIKLRKVHEQFEEQNGIPCIFVPLIGREGWPET
jgi:protein-L-isoaspartate(D-aspartate) O-methyltransferase